MREFDRLYEVIRILRSEQGCPWDREQTIPSMAENLLEEAYEVIDGIDSMNMEDLQEELGDLMFLTVFISYLAEQDGKFTVPEVVDTVSDKLVRRHPHVFGNDRVDGVDNVLKNWESIKKSEKKNLNRKTPLDGIPKSLPELIRFNKVIRKIEREGVDIASLDDISPESMQQSGADLCREFSSASLTTFLKKILLKSYIQSLDISAIIRSITRDIEADFLEKFKNNPKD